MLHFYHEWNSNSIDFLAQVLHIPHMVFRSFMDKNASSVTDTTDVTLAISPTPKANLGFYFRFHSKVTQVRLFISMVVRIFLTMHFMPFHRLFQIWVCFDWHFVFLVPVSNLGTRKRTSNYYSPWIKVNALLVTSFFTKRLKSLQASKFLLELLVVSNRPWYI